MTGICFEILFSDDGAK